MPSCILLSVNVIVDQLMTNYQLSGKGRLVLLLHGWGDSLATWKDLQKELTEFFQVLALDLPGFGNTETPKEVWDLDNYASFVAGLLTKLGFNQPYAVIGHSNGGALAIRAASLGKLQPKKMVLLASAGVRTNNRIKRFILKIIAKTGNAATFWLPERYRRALRKSLYGVAGSDMLMVPQLQDTFKKTVRQDVQGDAAAISVPTLLIYADGDDAVPLADGKQYQSLIKSSKLEVIARAGHFIHQDQPEQVYHLIKEFLQ